MTILDQRLDLPCGVSLCNRLAKAAMSEHQAEPDNTPGPRLARLYEAWAGGGTGLLITGNVMVDAASLESTRNVVLEQDSPLAPFEAWADAGCREGVHLWMQINHPGRQTPRQINPEPVAPSAVEPVALFRAVRAFAPPRALAPDEIEGIVGRYADAAELAQRAGFSGVQIHGAHGYLVAQFLSPLTNRRTDAWGGALDGRARFLRAVVAAIRSRVGAAFPIGVKLNTADFQRGGFEQEDCIQVVRWLEDDGVDLVELSGGNYESPAMFDLADSSRAREAYFLDCAARVREASRVPLMVTGGFRTIEVMEGALQDDVLDVIGLARPLAVEPDFSRKLLAGETRASMLTEHRVGVRTLDFFSEGALPMLQINRMARGKRPSRTTSALWATAANLYYHAEDALAHRLHLYK